MRRYRGVWDFPQLDSGVYHSPATTVVKELSPRLSNSCSVSLTIQMEITMCGYIPKDYIIQFQDVVCAWVVAAVSMVVIFSLM
jgi:hypothetical protein